MSWRSIIISKPARLSLKRGQMLIAQEQEISVPLEDIAFVLIEVKEATITVPLLSALAQNNITLLTCDNNFLPCGQWLGFGNYHRQLKILKLQMGMSVPLQKQLHKQIVCAKIANQSQVLKICDELAGAEHLESLIRRVRSGDTGNIEAQAARKYFMYLFGDDFYRRSDNAINAYLNYGYIILRSAVARSLVAHGYLPTLGIIHKNELNAFNLADDFIEAFRPIVDLYVYKQLQTEGLDNELSINSKQKLVALLHNKIGVADKVFTLLVGIDKSVESYKPALDAKQAKLLVFPKILGLGELDYE